MLLRERKLNRLKNFDYSWPGYYFITICTKNREEWFGNIVNKEMNLNKIGEIVKQQWLWLEKHFTHIMLDEWIIMPNHFHGIVIIQNVGTGLDLSLQKQLSLSNIIGAFKTTSSKLIHQSESNSFQWQRSFYDHVIRCEQSLFAIRRYIKDNSLKWEDDRNNSENLFM